MRVMNNIPALQTYNALRGTNSKLSKSIERLSSGFRLNSAADDAAGLAISEKMRAQIRGLDQASANAQDGISMIQTAEGALSETQSILQRMRELSVQAANDTLTQEDRSYIQLEIDQLKEEITRIANTTQFNRKKLLDGSAAVLWSSDSLSTRAMVRGGLRKVDQFGQKLAVDGNYKIEITAAPGEAQIKKTDIFKIKHENVIVDLQIDKNAGFDKLEINNMPAGSYNIKQIGAVDAGAENNYTSFVIATAAIAAATAVGTWSAQDYVTGGTNVKVKITLTTAVFYNGVLHKKGEDLIVSASIGTAHDNAAAAVALVFAAQKGNFALAKSVEHKSRYSDNNLKVQSLYGLKADSLGMNAASIGNENDLNASILLEVVNSDEASKTVTFRAMVHAVDVNGKQHFYSDENFVVTEEGIVTTGESKLGLYFINKDAFKINDVKDFQRGDKTVISLLASKEGEGMNRIAVSGTVNESWEWSWKDPAGGGAKIGAGYNFDVTTLAGKDVHLKNFYLNTSNGSVHEGDIRVSFGADMAAVTKTASVTRASFEASYVGQVAKGDVKLHDVDKFWDANGKFILEDSQDITIVQGDGKKAKLTLYSTDTLNDVRQKLNDAIAYGLGQSRYASEYANNFVSFVEEENNEANTSDAVLGTFVIRSLIPGAGGTLNFSGDENIIKAFSFNEIQRPKENTFSVSVSDAHTGMMVAVNQKVTGNVLYGVVNPHIDVEFDPMANITVTWNEQTNSFDLKRMDTAYNTILHLADNTTVFQIGANEGEDMGVDIGDMSSIALGIDGVLITDRDSAVRSITIIDSAINRVSEQRAKLGAYQNRLEHTTNNLTAASSNTAAAESRIRDADMAKEMMAFTKLNILSQAGNSMLAQANQLPQNVLMLLR